MVGQAVLRKWQGKERAAHPHRRLFNGGPREERHRGTPWHSAYFGTNGPWQRAGSPPMIPGQNETHGATSPASANSHVEDGKPCEENGLPQGPLDCEEVPCEHDRDEAE